MRALVVYTAKLQSVKQPLIKLALRYSFPIIKAYLSGRSAKHRHLYANTKWGGYVRDWCMSGIFDAELA